MEMTIDGILGICSALGAAFVGGIGWLWRLAGKVKADEIARIAELKERAEDKARHQRERAEDLAKMEALSKEIHDLKSSANRTSHQYAAIDAKMTLIFGLLGGNAKISLGDAVDALDEATAKGHACGGAHK